jgi:hypothetical protein
VQKGLDIYRVACNMLLDQFSKIKLEDNDSKGKEENMEE